MEQEKQQITGGCLCGAIKYEATEPPTDVGYCHCRMCQRSTGGAHGLFLLIPAKSFRFTKGRPKFYKSSAWAERGFCAECGTPLLIQDQSQIHGVMIGTLDHPEDWPPTQGHSGMESRIPWDTIDDDLPCWRTEDDPEYLASQAAFEEK